MKVIKSFSLRNTDLERLDYVLRKTGLNASECVRRLLLAYTEGAQVPGLPQLAHFSPTRTDEGTPIPVAAGAGD